MLDREYKNLYESIFKKTLASSPKNYFDESALPSYTHKNKLMSYLFWNRLNTAFNLAGDLKGKKVLDFGAGGGVTFKYLAEKGSEVYACEKEFYELTKNVAEILKLRIPVYTDIMDINDIKFDIIFALDVLEHIENLEPILKKFLQLSHKDSKFIISGPTENFLYKIGRFLAGFKGHYHLKNIYDIERDLEKAGLKLLKVKRLYPPVTLFRISLWEI